MSEFSPQRTVGLMPSPFDYTSILTPVFPKYQNIGVTEMYQFVTLKKPQCNLEVTFCNINVTWYQEEEYVSLVNVLSGVARTRQSFAFRNFTVIVHNVILIISVLRSFIERIGA